MTTLGVFGTSTVREHSFLETDPASPDEPLRFPSRLKGKWTIVSLQPGTCTYRAARHFIRYGFEETPELLCESDFLLAKRRAQVEKGSLLLLPCLHEVCAEVHASPHWELLEGYWFHLKNPPLYLGCNPNASRQRGRSCAAIPCLRPLLAEADGTCHFEFMDVLTTQQAASVVMEGHTCDYCVTNIYGIRNYGVQVVKELKCINVGWYLFQFEPKAWDVLGGVK